MTKTEKKPLTIRVGLYNKAFQMQDKENPDITEDWRVEKRKDNRLRWPARFEISLGKMVWRDEVYETTFVLEIHYQGSYDSHRRRLGAFSFGSHLYGTFAEVAHKLAEGFCKRHGLTMSNHLNSFPEFQAIVFRPLVD